MSKGNYPAFAKELSHRIKLPEGIKTVPPAHPTPGAPAERRAYLSTFSGGGEFFNDPLNRKIKIALIVDGPFLSQPARCMESFGFEWVHVQGDVNPKMPKDVDAAIINTSSCSHNAMYAVKDWGKANDKKVFVTKNGFSEIKEDFERYFLGFVDDLKKLNIPQITKWMLLLCFYARVPGSKVSRREMVSFCDRVGMPIDTQNAGNLMTVGKKNGILTPGRIQNGVYTFNGITKTYIDYANKYGKGVPFPPQWIVGEGAPALVEEEGDITPPPYADTPYVEKKTVELPFTPEQVKAGTVEPKKEPEDIQVPGPSSKLTAEDKLELLMLQVHEMQEKMHGGGMDRKTLLDKVHALVSAMPTKKLASLHELLANE